jgi:cellulose synthase/poly-beta-1,6-N-acetylglucosamine synthase-like glycosyltransferase
MKYLLVPGFRRLEWCCIELLCLLIFRKNPVKKPSSMEKYAGQLKFPDKMTDISMYLYAEARVVGTRGKSGGEMY